MTRFFPRAALGLAAAVLLAGLAACPQPLAHHVLHVTAQGNYQLDGVTLAPDELVPALAARQAVEAGLAAQIVTEPTASMDSVRFAVAALKQLHARISFADERMVKRLPPELQLKPAELSL